MDQHFPWPAGQGLRRHGLDILTAGLSTDTGYTSWSIDRSIAEAAAEACSQDEGLSGRIRIFRVRIDTLDLDRVFEGRADEDEYLIEGTVENVEVSKDATDEEDDE
jgi:hypothetical protein